MSPNLEFAGSDVMKYVLVWYASSMIYSAYNKKALRVFPYPLLLSAAQVEPACESDMTRDTCDISRDCGAMQYVLHRVIRSVAAAG